MELEPIFKKRKYIGPLEYTAHYKFDHFRCHLRVSEAGIKIVITGGAEGFGEPGEQFIFFQKAASLDEAIKIAESLPKIGPDDAEKYGFEKISYAILN